MGKLDVQRSSLAAHKANIDVWNNTLYYLRALLSALLDTSEGGEKSEILLIRFVYTSNELLVIPAIRVCGVVIVTG